TAFDTVSELWTVHNTFYQRAETEVGIGRLVFDGAYGRHVVVLQAAPQGISEQFLGNGADKQSGTFHQCVMQIGSALDRRAVGENARGIDLGVTIVLAPGADRIEVFQRKADRVHHAVAGGTGGIGAVRFKTLTYRRGER